MVGRKTEARGEQGGHRRVQRPTPPSPSGCRLRSIVRLVILLSDEDGVWGRAVWISGLVTM